MDEIVANLKNVQKDYLSQAPAQVRLLDAFLAFSFFTAGVQVLYMLLVGTFPFNSFLAGLSSCAGVFVFTRKSQRFASTSFCAPTAVLQSACACK